MSIKIMSIVWDNKELTTTDKMVLLCLADHANDEGVCYPSIGRLSQRTSLSQRAVRYAKKRLIEAGYLSVENNAGRGGADLYQIVPTPAPRAPLHDVHPGTTCTPPLHDVPPTPAPRAPKPSRTIIEPSIGDFDEFWDVVPRKAGKGAARKAYAKALKKAGHESLVAGMAAYARIRAGQDQRFTVHPATWLNEERWDDDVRAGIQTGGRAVRSDQVDAGAFGILKEVK